MKFLLSFFLLTLSASPCFALDAAKIVKDAIDYYRDTTSVTEASMTVHRPDWERHMSLRSWTRGSDESLVRFTAPAKDAGSASLTLDDEMWSFSPKVNRVMKIPASMMHQSWMGSDFSYNDLSKADDIVDDYTHKLLKEEKVDGQNVYTIESIPKESAPVVWGKEVMRIRDDHVILEHDYYDQDMKLLKRMQAREIKPMGGKIFAAVLRMQNMEKPEEWTEVRHDKVTFGEKFAESVFTLSNLSNPR